MGKKKPHPLAEDGAKTGGDLLSHLAAVPSALAGLTALFGMGRGGAPPPSHLSLLGIRPYRASPNLLMFDILRTKRRLPAKGAALSELYWAISTARLSALQRVHLRPINVVVSHGP